MTLWIVTFRWGNKFPLDDVRKLRDGFARRLAEPHEFVCITDDATVLMKSDIRSGTLRDPELTHIRGCFARLRLFDPDYQFDLGVAAGDRIVCCDLDVVVTGALAPLFNRHDPFLILQGANALNPCPYNGSLWALFAGYRPDVWRDFSLDAARRVPYHEFPDDQGWMAARMPGAAGWRVGKPSGVYAYQKPGWPPGDDLPADARMVVFPGWRSPQRFKHLPWVRQHWC